jgi:hypothetical protein
MSCHNVIALFVLVLVLAVAPGCSGGLNYGESWGEQLTAEPGECPS